MSINDNDNDTLKFELHRYSRQPTSSLSVCQSGLLDPQRLLVISTAEKCKIDAGDQEDAKGLSAIESL
ncbi:predicted protein [Botrytis cinerea T4]|uniref:Uncharacterized protein n=1 Tax=Botryotinia fuckeliana (strain T4) TaxID=999810 RepID=G2Y4D9_BOTF4|nr:predicted protein [Botrytis cinerea T4]